LKSRVDPLPLIPSVWAQNTPGYNNKIPPQIMTPDTFDDLPTKETSQKKVYDNLDLMRGVEVFLNFISAASLEAILRARQNRVTKSNQVLIFRPVAGFNPVIPNGQYRHRLWEKRWRRPILLSPPISLSRTDPFLGFVRSRQRVVRRGWGKGTRGDPRHGAGGFNSTIQRRMAANPATPLCWRHRPPSHGRLQCGFS
jgi:hypothetical protein